MPLPCVSRRHCLVEVDDGGTVWVRDLGSLNGTWVNGRRVERARLGAGDRLRVGPAVFELVPEFATQRRRGTGEVVVAGAGA